MQCNATMVRPLPGLYVVVIYLPVCLPACLPACLPSEWVRFINVCEMMCVLRAAMAVSFRTTVSLRSVAHLCDLSRTNPAHTSERTRTIRRKIQDSWHPPLSPHHIIHSYPAGGRLLGGSCCCCSATSPCST